jgi:hypothetical protein
MRVSFSRSTVWLLGSSCAAWVALACSAAPDSGVQPSASGGSTLTGGGAGLGSGGSSASSGTGGNLAGNGTGGNSGGSAAGASAVGGSGGTGVSAGGSANVAGVGSGGSNMATGGMSGRGGSGSPDTGGSAGVAGGAGMGGSAGLGSGGASAGMSGSGGAMGGRSGAGGMASAGTGNTPAIGPRPCGCETPAGEFGTVDSTIVVDSGEVYDGACKIFRANPETLGAGDQGEGQLPIFRVEDGGTLKNVVIGASGADGVHLYGDVTLENIHWLDIGEDAMTVKESGTVYLDCGSSAHGDDKTFQVNAASDIFISNFTATDAGKFMRQNGDTTFEVNVTIDHSDISFMDEGIFRTDSSSSHVTFTNSRYSNLGDGLFIFGDAVVNGNSAQSTVSNLVEY